MPARSREKAIHWKRAARSIADRAAAGRASPLSAMADGLIPMKDTAFAVVDEGEWAQQHRARA
jgi:hypothetical protein